MMFQPILSYGLFYISDLGAGNILEISNMPGLTESPVTEYLCMWHIRPWSNRGLLVIKLNATYSEVIRLQIITQQFLSYASMLILGLLRIK